MAWVWLVIAGALEVGWAFGLKYSAGLTKLWPSVFTVVAMLLSFATLAQAMKHLPLGTAYGVWTGIGTVGAAIIGMIVFKEPATAPRLFFLLLLIIGLIGLKATSPQ